MLVVRPLGSAGSVLLAVGVEGLGVMLGQTTDDYEDSEGKGGSEGMNVWE